MVARRRGASTRSSRQNGSPTRRGTDIYAEMLLEAGVDVTSPQRRVREPPAKRRRVEETQQSEPVQHSAPIRDVPASASEYEDDGSDEEKLPSPNKQTMELDSDDEDEDEDIDFEDVKFEAWLNGTTVPEEPKELELNLTAQKQAATPTKRSVERRKPLTREERDRRTRIHQTHLLCLLAHVARRNHWCNDAQVQKSLRPHLTGKMVKYLNPGLDLPQFGRAESLKNGLRDAGVMWKTKFEVTERGLRRPLWAEDASQLEDVSSSTKQPMMVRGTC